MTGIVGLYFTDSLYEPESELTPQRSADAGTRLRKPLEPPGAVSGDSDDELLPLRATSLGCAASWPCAVAWRRADDASQGGV